ncbi:hypothetical protein [Hymenobacter sp. BT491]|uniref:hypothetical protein n=1 Tax=Hymenobacter sp. BT491 TaxID=2766779 RepID=UPI001653661F|nr:hypothetical protein [Hymenobacter sp. BT491]MBC6988540.1 hypothetical protein [Hymenobacter sp. BT491]
MTALATIDIAPLAVRDLMPANYLKSIQEQLTKKKQRAYSDSVISDVVSKARTTHPVWPLALKLAKQEKARRQREEELNAEYLKAKTLQA